MLLLLLLAAGTVTAEDGKAYSFPAGDAPRIEVKNIAGGISVQGEDRADVEITVTRTGGSEEERRSWTVALEPSAAGLSAQACCGGCGRVRQKCSSRDRVEVSFVLRVPRGARLVLSSVSGDVRAGGVSGAQHVETVSGAVSLQGSREAAEVSSVSGEIELAPALVAATRVSSVSGSVKLRLPRGAGARISLSTVSGKLVGRRGANRLTVGQGGPRVDLETVSGNVTLVE